MEKHVENLNNSINVTTEVYMLTSEVSISNEEKDAIVTLVIVVIGIIISIMVLFSMGIFIDYKHQKTDSIKKKKLRLKIPSLTRRKQKDEVIILDVCSNDTGFRIRDAVV